MADEKQYLTAREAAAELNVSRATLYAYVSRGQIRSEASGNSRSRLYRADDVRALRARKGPGRDPESIAGDALNFGLPVLDSSLTLIADGRLYYRGRDAARLARAASLETVAGLLWDAGEADPFADNPPPDVAVPDGLDGMVRCQAMLPWAAEADARAYNLEAAGVARTGARILRLLAAGVAGTPAGDAPIHGVLGDAWGVDAAGADLLAEPNHTSFTGMGLFGNFRHRHVHDVVSMVDDVVRNPLAGRRQGRTHPNKPRQHPVDRRAEFFLA